MDVSSPFTSVQTHGRGTWTTQETVNGDFQNIIATGGINIAEVGYGEGGYGEGGYDTPGVNIPASSQPIWTVETTK